MLLYVLAQHPHSQNHEELSQGPVGISYDEAKRRASKEGNTQKTQN